MTQLPIERPQDTAANEDFTGKFRRPEVLTQHEGAWDAYAVWRTRVKAPPHLAQQDDAKTPAPHRPGF